MEIESLRFEDHFFFLSDTDRVPGLAIQEAQTVSHLFEAALDPSDTDYLDDRTLVEQSYANILDRDPLRSGVDFWTDRLSDPGVSRADVLVAFATCAENVANSEYIEDIAETAPGEWSFS